MASGARSGVLFFSSTLAGLAVIVAAGLPEPLWGQSTTLGTSASATNPQRSGDATTGLFSDTASTVEVAAGGTKVMSIGTNGILNIPIAPASGSFQGSLQLNGNNAIWQDPANLNLVIGASAFPQTAVTGTATGNTAIGLDALTNGTTANGNVAIGSWAMQWISTGTGNTAIGARALSGACCASSASSNTAIGGGTLQNVSTGSYNIAIGGGGLYSTTSGDFNTAMGVDALVNSTTGILNTALGYYAGSQVTTGNGNTILGAGVAENTLKTGSSNILIGAGVNNSATNGVDTPASNTSNFLNIGNAIFATGMTGTVSAPAGNVGIGTTSPGYKLDVQAGQINSSGGYCISGATPNCITSWPTGGGGGTGTVTSVTAGLGLSGGPITTSGALALDLTHANSWTGAQSFGGGTSFPGGVWSSAGKVGIGSAAPSAPLHVVGANQTAILQASAAGNGESLLFEDGGSPTKYNWLVGAQYNVNNGFEITPSTAVGGGTFSTPALAVLNNGSVGIGTNAPCGSSAPSGCVMSVNGAIQAKAVIVNTNWSDYVFDRDYHLAPLREVAAYVEKNHHLPEIPSAKEVEEKGVSLGEMQAKLLAKIEELTLHMIEAEKENQDLRREIQDIKAAIAK